MSPHLRKVSQIKTSTEIYNSLINFLEKTQKQITDFSVTSTASGIAFAAAGEIENVYREVDEVKKQAFIATSTGKNVDLHIEGTYGLSRDSESRSTCYVVYYANAPIQDTTTTKLWCAKYNRDTDQFLGLDKALRMVTSGADQVAGKVFVLVAPKNEDFVQYDANENGYYIDFKANTPQFVVLPVVSLLKGSNMNVPENAINIMADSVPGLNGVTNTYSPILTFFGSYGDLGSTQTTPILKFAGSKLEVVNGSKFPSVGLLQIENVAGKILKGIYRSQDGAIITLPIKIAYDESYSRYFLVPPLVNPLIHTKFENNNTTKSYFLEKVIFEGAEQVVTDINAYLTTLLGNVQNTGKYIVRQVLADIDKRAIFDPDRVIADNGTLVESAKVSGGADGETDSSYKLRLRKYLSSLGRAIPSALEAGALTVDGVNFAKSLPKHLAPRGTSILLVAGDDGNLTNQQLFEVRRVVEQEWKSAGEGLIIKTPERVDVSVLARVSVAAGYSKSVISSQIKNIIRRYVNGKEPGSVLSVNDLIADIKNVEGVATVWNAYIGKSLTEGTYRYITSVEKPVQSNSAPEDFNIPVMGYGHGILARIFNSGDPVVTGGHPGEIAFLNKSTVSGKNFYQVQGVRRVGPSKEIANLADPKFLIFMGLVHNGENVTSPQSELSFSAYQNIFKTSSSNSGIVNTTLRSALGDDYELELIRFLTEPLTTALTTTTVLPISFDRLMVRDLEPYELDITQLPVIGAFNDGLSSIEMIGVEFV